METRLKRVAEIKLENFSASLDRFANEHLIDWYNNAKEALHSFKPSPRKP